MWELTNGFERLSTNDQGYLVTNLGARKYIYHLSPNKSIKELVPRTDTHSEKSITTGTKKNTNRVCFSDTIHGGISALMLPTYTTNFDTSDLMLHLRKARVDDRTYKLWLYRCDTSLLHTSKISISDDESHNNELGWIFDRHITGEIGYYGEAPVENVGTITIRMRTEAQHKKEKYKYLIHGMRVYEPTDADAFRTFIAFDLTSDNEVITEEMLQQDREDINTRYLLYHLVIQKNLQIHQRAISKYLATDRI